MGTKAVGAAMSKAAGTVATQAATGPSIMFTLDQMQSLGASGAMAPADLPAFRAVAGSIGWTLQIPLPFLDWIGE
jgi:hypothetical protein